MAATTPPETRPGLPSRRGALRALAAFAATLLAWPQRVLHAQAAFTAITQPDQPGPAGFMARAFAMRRESLARGDQPYGAVLVLDGRIVGEGISAVLTANDPTAHAEMQALRDAQRRLGRSDLSGAVLYGTSRACPMCEAGAARARVARMLHGESLQDAGAPRAG